MRPDAVEDEELLNEDAAERQKSTKYDSHCSQNTRPPLRDFPRFWSYSHWRHNCL